MFKILSSVWDHFPLPVQDGELSATSQHHICLHTTTSCHILSSQIVSLTFQCQPLNRLIISCLTAGFPSFEWTHSCSTPRLSWPWNHMLGAADVTLGGHRGRWGQTDSSPGLSFHRAIYTLEISLGNLSKVPVCKVCACVYVCFNKIQSENAYRVFSTRSGTQHSIKWWLSQISRPSPV